MNKSVQQNYFEREKNQLVKEGLLRRRSRIKDIEIKELDKEIDSRTNLRQKLTIITTGSRFVRIYEERLMRRISCKFWPSLTGGTASGDCSPPNKWSPQRTKKNSRGYTDRQSCGKNCKPAVRRFKSSYWSPDQSFNIWRDFSSPKFVRPCKSENVFSKEYLNCNPDDIRESPSLPEVIKIRTKNHFNLQILAKIGLFLLISSSFICMLFLNSDQYSHSNFY